MKLSTKSSQRQMPLVKAEMEAFLKDNKLMTNVAFLNGTTESIEYDIMTTVAHAVEAIAKKINLEAFKSFSLYAVQRIPADEETGEASYESSNLLDDSKYISDILSNAKAQGIETTLLFKQKMFREQDEHIIEPTFVNMSYMQAHYDFLQGNYPVTRDDASQMCALQIFAGEGPGLDERSEEFSKALDKNLCKQTRMSRPGEEWRKDVYRRYQALSSFNEQQAKLQFLRILRSLPYGNAIFYPVKRVEDPIGLLPSKLILGINKRGVHFFRPVPKEYLHSAELRDIMQFGSSTSAVFFKMRVAGVLHVFQFDTRQGADICMTLQTHIGDIMMKRYAKTKEHRRNAKSAAFTQANFGAKYDQHLKLMQKKVAEAEGTIDELEKGEKNAEYELEKKREQLVSIRENFATIDTERQNLNAELAAGRKEIHKMTEQLNEIKSVSQYPTYRFKREMCLGCRSNRSIKGVRSGRGHNIRQYSSQATT